MGKSAAVEVNLLTGHLVILVSHCYQSQAITALSLCSNNSKPINTITKFLLRLYEESVFKPWHKPLIFFHCSSQ